MILGNLVGIAYFCSAPLCTLASWVVFLEEHIYQLLWDYVFGMTQIANSLEQDQVMAGLDANSFFYLALRNSTQFGFELHEPMNATLGPPVIVKKLTG